MLAEISKHSNLKLMEFLSAEGRLGEQKESSK
jgi:hypothetical protein